MSKTSKTVEETYTKKQLYNSIIDEPGMYLGTITPDNVEMEVYDFNNDAIVKRNIEYIQGLYKIFDEIIVNARDHAIKDITCKNIIITIDKKTGLITCFTDGNEDAIPVVIHKGENMYVPQMLFSELLTSGNYNKKGKITGGKHGYGAKLANIFSSKFIIEVGDTINKKKYLQVFENKMSIINPPTITKYAGKSYLKISFVPDYKTFHTKGLSDDMYALFTKRVYDIVANLSKEGRKITIELNEKVINIQSFEKFVDMFYKVDTLDNEMDNEGDEEEDEEETEENIKKKQPIKIKKICTTTTDKRWQVCVVYDSKSNYRQVSYVNGLCTINGGTHVNYVVDMIVNDLEKRISNKYKDIQIRKPYIKNNLSFFIDATIEDPDFDSQTKDTLKSIIKNFGSTFYYNEKFINDIMNTGLVNEVVEFSRKKELLSLKGQKVKNSLSIKGIKGYEEAIWVSKKDKRVSETRLILTEGGSAKTFAVSGLSSIGYDKYGIFPLKGKVLNVRTAQNRQLISNAEIKNIIKIIGLDASETYDNLKKLRYGGIIILTDQDTDGAHIKGLLINFIHFFWPELIYYFDGFIQTMTTPIMKAFLRSDTKKKNGISFGTIAEYLKWSKTTKNANNYVIKYYKGLGTHTAPEAKECFEDFSNKLISYTWDKYIPSSKSIKQGNLCEPEKMVKKNKVNDTSSQNSNTSNKTENLDEIMLNDFNNPTNYAINLAFNKKMADKRREWLASYDKNDVIDNEARTVTICQFVHKDLKHFSSEDNIRSIPALIDGLKPSTRKILYTAFKEKLFKKEAKVVELGGATMKETAYHHGDASLYGAIIGMARRFVGSNNISILYPSGQFGSRLQGGKDAASPRYIYTRLDDLTRLIFREDDEIILQYEIDDGKKIEPTIYIPIIPMLLVNGSEGIGTGHSTYIPPYNPIDIINNIINMLNNKKIVPMKPWFRGFKGAIEHKDKGSYITKGIYNIVDENTIQITELPIGKWTEKYKSDLYKITIGGEQVEKDNKKEKGKNKKTVTPILKNFILVPLESSVNITLYFVEGVLQNLIKQGTLEKKLGLTSSINIDNMKAHSTENHIKNYKTPEDIMIEYFDYRFKQYEFRKQRLSLILENELNISKYKIKFLEDYTKGKIVLHNKNEKEVFAKLESLNYPKLSNKINFDDENEKLIIKDDNQDDQDNQDNKKINEYIKTYKYITDMKLWSLTVEKLNKLKEELDIKKARYQKYVETPVKDIWMQELLELKQAYLVWFAEVEAENDDGKPKTVRKKQVRKPVAKKQ
ncbi:DNA gyrase/topoisomerase IV [Hokovirus HKV1]|uniref:DNA topoisomerase 2 n=1 Tax=Hokovirus HKV1 TaxID=1977638 RepID=A0A1V0SFY2_9VIRU|nr:DNA gyrase/topoisomerase IV [Hokovirus HKV1]